MTTVPIQTDSSSPARTLLRSAIRESVLPNYVYSYPSKRAYRPFDPPPSIAEIWRDKTGSLNLYVHIPFCSYHCHFCTLFTVASHSPALVDAYLASLKRQIAMYGSLTGHLQVVSLYFGGGTPTALSNEQFTDLFATIHRAFPRFSASAEISVEGSPDSMTMEKLQHLAALGVNRVSMGLQTLDAEELRRIGRPYTIERALDAIADIGRLKFENVNYDLIYGLEAQTPETWSESLRRTVGFAPTTVTLYPVVFRPLTVIDRLRTRDDRRFAKDGSKYELYDQSVDYLQSVGYHQDTFVRFTTLPNDGYQQEANDFNGVPLIGLGAGARSYSDSIHYGTDFAVGRSSSQDIIDGFIAHPHDANERIRLGFSLDDQERRRRYVILTLSLGRVSSAAYGERFGSTLERDFGPELAALRAEECLSRTVDGTYSLTRKGFKYSSLIATLFYSERVQTLERAFVPK